MRNLLALAGLASLIFLGLGWYLGWYKIQNAAAPDGHRHIQIDVDTNKVKSDVSKGESKLHDLLTDQPGASQQNSSPPSSPSGTSGTTVLYRTQDGGFVFPANGATPPASGPLLPPPR
jgi:hypothetical protein